jgi:hypothetical protein
MASLSPRAASSVASKRSGFAGGFSTAAGAEADVDAAGAADPVSGTEGLGAVERASTAENKLDVSATAPRAATTASSANAQSGPPPCPTRTRKSSASRSVGKLKSADLESIAPTVELGGGTLIGP